MTDHSGQRPGRPRDPEVDAAVLASAREVFVERGVEATSIEAVARRAGVSRLTVYRRYRNKQELLVAMLVWSRDEPGLDLDPERARLDELTEVLTRALVRPQVQQLLVRVAGAAIDHPELIRAFWRSFVQPRRAELAAVLVRMQELGRFEAAADPDAVMDMVAGAVLYHLVMRPDERDEDALRVRARAALRHAGLREDR